MDKNEKMEDIAIIGMACRFPGDATTPEKLWQMMVNKESAWSEFPKDRLNIDGYYHPSGDRQGSISFKGAHFIKNDVAAFDASFFSIMAEDAKAIDPQQRFLLEVSYEALENAGLRTEDLKGSPTAVYVGSFVKDYEQICLRDMDWQPQYAATGTGNAIMANRVSYTYDFKGPSMTLDTGCSGSLVAVHLAAQALRTGDCDLASLPMKTNVLRMLTFQALAAGAGLILTPNTMMPMTALNFLSPDGKCFAFDSRANGYGRGEGIGFVVLKKMSHALRDNDTIRAVIRGTHVNQDGLTTGITLPSKKAQVANIRSLYSKYNLEMQQTAFVECHGTGTQAGDFRELSAISETLAADRPKDKPVFVGSVKTNIGHLEGAAGVAGLIKGVLLTEKGQIPPNINFKKGNPNIDFENWKVKVPTDLTSWPVEGPRQVSVNCFGFGGTNAHAVLDEPSRYFSARKIVGNHNSTIDADSNLQSTPVAASGPQLFVFSSNERNGVSRVMSTHAQHIGCVPKLPQSDANDYAYTLACRRSVMEWKDFVVANGQSELIKKLATRKDQDYIRSNRDSKLKIAFIFCGQGAQWPQMGRELMSFGPFKASLEAAAAYIKTLGSDFDLIEEIMKDKQESRIQEPQISQPATTAIQVALVDLLRAFSIAPSSVVGHSSGEIAAAYASSCIDSETAWALAYHRGYSASILQTNAPQIKGKMCAVRMSCKDAQRHLENKAQHRDLGIACVNSPTSVTISGSAGDIDWLRDELKKCQVLCKILDVDIAYHSRHMKLVEEDYKDLIKHTRTTDSPTGVQFFSSVQGRLVQGSSLGYSYWAENLVSPVQFVEAVKSLMESDHQPDLLIELSPHGTLESALSEIIDAHSQNIKPAYLPLMRRLKDASVTALEAIGGVWARGYPVDMLSVISKGNTTGSYKTLVNLPSYPWNHQKQFWHESHTCTEHRFRNFGREDLIGAPSPDATTFEPRWRGFFRIAENPWVQDHRVQKTIVYPAAGMVTMALQAASQLSMDMADVLGFQVTNLRIERAMIIPSTAFGLEYSLNLKQISTKPEADPEWEFSIYSKQEQGAWIRHADGHVKIRRSTTASPLSTGGSKEKYSEVHALCDKSLPPRQLYEILDVVGLNYGPCFQNVVSISTYRNSCISKVRVPDTKSKMPCNFEYAHVIHPATLDSMFQTLFAIDSKPMVPSMIDSIFVAANISCDIGYEFTGYATAERSGLRDAKGSITMVSGQDGWDSPSVVVEGLHLTALATPSVEEGGFIPNHRNLCSEIVWKENYVTSITEDFDHMLSLAAHKYPSLAILQCGGNEQLAKHVLEVLSEGGAPRVSRYTVLDGSTFSVLKKKCEHSSALNVLEQRNWPGDKEKFPRYNIVITAKDSSVDQEDAFNLLAPEGLLLNEVSHLACDEGTDDLDELIQPADAHHLRATYELEADDAMSPWVIEQHFEARFFVNKVDMASTGDVVIIVPDDVVLDLVGLVNALIQLFLDKGFKVIISTVSNVETFYGKNCISLVEVCDNFVYNWTEKQFNDFHKLRETAKSVLWVTRSANRHPTDPHNAPIIALARTILSEDPQKTIVTLDLDVDTSIDSASLPHTIWTVAESILTKCQEAEFAEEDGKLYIPRLMPLKALNKLIESESRIQLENVQVFDPSAVKTSYEMVISKPGIAAESFHFVENRFTSPLGQHEVEIRTVSASLSSDDFQTAMGRTTEVKLGLDVMGVVTRVGSAVKDYHRGKQVMAIVPGAFKSVHRVDQKLVKSVPLPIERCHFTPSGFIAASYALQTIGRLSSKKKVLIHAGASAYGQAALRIASHIGAEIFATVLNDTSGDQRKTLRDAHGLLDDHMLDASSESFVADVLATGKVDVVYNPTQEHIVMNAKCVKASGCIIQLADKTGSAVQAPVSTTTFVKLDLSVLLEEDPELVMELFQHVDQLMPKRTTKNSSLHCDPVRRFDMSDFESAFKHMDKEPYLGLTMMEAKPDTCVPVAKEMHTKSLASVIEPDGTYILAGGLGGLGRSIAKLLADNGAKKLVFLSRSGGGPDAEAFLKSLKGVCARSIAVDIMDTDALKRLVPELGKVSGVVQCAAVLQDALFEKMTHADWTTAFGPKAVGASNLVDVFCSDDNPSSPSPAAAPWFLFLSSASGIIGNRGQANYAAANAVQDALAHSVSCATSLDLGPVLEAGMLVGDEETLGKLRGAGFYGIRHDDFIEMVSRAITGEVVPGIRTPPRIVSGVGTGGLIRQNNPGDPFWSRTAMYSYMNTVDIPVTAPDDNAGQGPGEDDVKRMLAKCGGREEAGVIITAGLVQLLAKAMSLLPEEIDPEKAPSAYGVDSLVAVGIRN